MFGKKCTKCWVNDIERTVNSHCPNCLGTGYKGGYLPGRSLLLQYDPTPNDAQVGYQGRVEPNEITGWTVSFPNIEYWDIILRVPDGKAYRVEQVTTTELQTVPVRQMMRLQELSKDSVEMRLLNQAYPDLFQFEEGYRV
jgi:hypothetical protein